MQLQTILSTGRVPLNFDKNDVKIQWDERLGDYIIINEKGQKLAIGYGNELEFVFECPMCGDYNVESAMNGFNRRKKICGICEESLAEGWL